MTRHSISLVVLLSLLPAVAFAAIEAGVAKTSITPPVGTPLSGFGARKGAPSIGVHDPLEARALALSTGGEKIVFVAVDHLGYDSKMVARLRSLASQSSGIPAERIFVMASHTHSGGGAYREGSSTSGISGKFDPKIRAFYEEQAAEAVRLAVGRMKPAKVGFGSGLLPGLSRFRSSWPPDWMPELRPVDPSLDVMRVDDASTGKPMAVLFNFAAHGTVLPAENLRFSSDWIGYARTEIERLVGGDVMALFANGAQGTISPRPPKGREPFERAESLGTSVGIEAYRVTQMIEPKGELQMRFARTALPLKPQMREGALMGRDLGDSYSSEVAAVSFDNRAVIATVPGELSSIINQEIKQRSRLFGFEQTFLFGITNDALAYIVTEDQYRHNTYEGRVSFFGPGFGSLITNEVFQLLEKLSPRGKTPPSAGALK